MMWHRSSRCFPVCRVFRSLLTAQGGTSSPRKRLQHRWTIIMVNTNAIVYVVDQDNSMRIALRELLGSVNLEVHLFSSPLEFLASTRPDVPACLVLDVRLPGMSGLTLQNELARMGVDLPLIFITGHGDIRMGVRAMKAGAIDFLAKPFRDQDVLDAIMRAVERHRLRREAATAETALRDLYDDLSDRERQVMTLVT